jgi:hypothetical protein
MSLFKSQLIATLILILSGHCISQAVQSETEPDLTGQVQVQVVNTSLVSYSTSKLALGVTIAITSKRDVTLDQILLADLRLNGLPLYAAPMASKLQLKAGNKTVLPDPLPVTVYLRDLDSVAPLHDAMANEHATLDGMAYATVHLNLLETMVLFTKHVDVAANIHEEVPFTVPGGAMARTAALTLLQGADKALRAISTTVDSGRNWASGFRHAMMKDYAPRLLLAYSRFELKDKQGQTTASDWHGVAVALGPDLLLVPREAIEPWKFDAELADAISSKRLSLNRSSYDLWLWPASAHVLNSNKELNSDTALRLSKQQFSVASVPDQDQHKLLALEDSGKTKKISLQKRDSSSDLALLQITESSSKLDRLQTAENSSATDWNSVAIFRFRDGIHGSSADPELIVVPAKRNGDRILLGELVDSSAFGSPIVAAEGVIGIVQDQGSGVAWEEAARVLKLKKTKLTTDSH